MGLCAPLASAPLASAAGQRPLCRPVPPPRENRGTTDSLRPHMQREALGPSVLEGEGIGTYMPTWELLSLPSRLLPAGSGLQWPCTPAVLYQGNQTLPSPPGIHLTHYFECPSE